ncbi:MAG: hypothetical protein J5845_08075 [Lachnospiraceae bacterium]|nr:hypothetical protein [Lachnospiraceae bacterium]
MADLDKDEFSPSSVGKFRDESERKLYEALRRNPKLDYDPDEDEVTEEQYRAMVERRRRIAERRDAGRAKRMEEAHRIAEAQKSTRGAEEQRTGRKVPAATKPVQRSGETVSRSASSSAKKPVTRQAAKEEAAARAAKTGRKVFYICLGVYAAILVILGFIFLRYTDKCLRRYEASRYENVIDDKMNEFVKSVKDGTVLDMVTLPEHACVFEDENLYRSTYLNNLRASGTFTYEKDKNSYDTTHPVFDIYSASGDMVAVMQLKQVNPRTIFAILTISDWEIDSITPVFSMTTNSYRISVPDNYKVTVNDIAVTDEFRKGEPKKVETDLSENILKYVQVPSIITYEITGLAEKPEIKIYDSLGVETGFTPDGNGNIKIDAMVGTHPAEMSQERYDYALETVQMWGDFVTRDLSGAQYGLSKMRKRLAKDSFLYQEAARYATSEDITFISDHHFDTPKYTDLSVTDYTEYSDVCYSVHIKFTRNMILNKTGGKRTDGIDSIFFFVFIDDTDNDVIDPHWVIAEEKVYIAENK